MRYQSPIYEDDIVKIKRQSISWVTFGFMLFLSSSFSLGGLLLFFLAPVSIRFLALLITGLGFLMFGVYLSVSLPKKHLLGLFPDWLIFDNTKGCLRFIERNTTHEKETFLPYDEIDGFRLEERREHEESTFFVCLRKKDGAMWELFEFSDKRPAEVWFQNLQFSVDLNTLCGRKFVETSFKKIVHQQESNKDFLFWPSVPYWYVSKALMTFSLPFFALSGLFFASKTSALFWLLPVVCTFPFFFTLVKLLRQKSIAHQIVIDEDKIAYWQKYNHENREISSISLADIESVYFNVKMHDNQEIVSITASTGENMELLVDALPITDRINLEKILQKLVMERTGFKPA